MGSSPLFKKKCYFLTLNNYSLNKMNLWKQVDISIFSNYAENNTIVRLTCNQFKIFKNIQIMCNNKSLLFLKRY